jgi:single stranded DNA-binding protein
MDKASFDIVGNIGKVEIKTFATDRRMAVLSVATSERRKAADGTKTAVTFWHRVTVFAPALVNRIQAMVQKGTRVRLVGTIRPGSYDDASGQTRYAIEFVVGPFGELEVLARAKPAPQQTEAA